LQDILLKNHADMNANVLFILHFLYHIVAVFCTALALAASARNWQRRATGKFFRHIAERLEDHRVFKVAESGAVDTSERNRSAKPPFFRRTNGNAK
jgi:hypothetical protein